ncbi:peroxide stress protein YaaA [Saxibacter everestensis]|uniref:Peroxide stress protein YaaA n=1 Tax=Saxibacter everestensis TaxID=2909229 RepID=A0ABY8QYK3_9MICO|nr:peroxide stress protein YaaA [Brevibacteriaceae bacterium ZFBP1038]
MLILLPPSEGKTPVASGRPVTLESLTFPSLATDRAELMKRLAEVSAADDALEILGVGSSLLDDVRRNTGLESEPAATAARIYTGVLFNALGAASLSARGRKRARESVLVFSGLWGAVGLRDRIPAYRLSMAAALPGTGKLASWWKPRLTPLLDQASDGQLVVDCRSSTYSAAWKPPTDRTVAVRVFREAAGSRSVISHMAKETRGELTRHLLERDGRPPRTPAQLLAAANEKWTAELVPVRGGTPCQLDIVLK